MARVGYINSKITIGIFFLFTVTIGCKENSSSKAETDDEVKSTTKLRIPPFNADSAYQYIADQVAFGPRLPGSEGQKKAIAYYQSTLERLGATVQLQAFEAKRHDGVLLEIVNILAKINPKKSKRMLLCAHYDSRYVGDNEKDLKKRSQPILGADDGGSGVGVILEIARQIQTTPLIDIGLDIVFFDAEDQGSEGSGIESAETWCLGSQYWAKKIGGKDKPRWGILLDMVGAADARFPKEGHSYSETKRYVDKIWRLSQGMGYGNLFVNDIGRRITDDHIFIMRDAKIPMVDIIHLKVGGGFGAYHHTHDDNMTVIDKKTLKAVGQTTLASIYHYHNGTL